MKTLREIRLKAADIIEKNGWCQGAYREVHHNDDGTLTRLYCLVGACLEASGYYAAAATGRAAAAVSAAHAGAAAAATADVTTAEMWNDTPGRTAQEVINALRKGLVP